MEKLTVDAVKSNGWLIFEAIAGSKAYGLDNEKSDTDIRGVFILPKDEFYGMTYTAQVNNESNDIVYYELKRFMELLSKNNPNILEMLNIPGNRILHKDSIMDMIRPEIFLSKLCEQTFANYAYTQIKKAYGLEKKIFNPVEEERKSVLDFCFVYVGKEAIPVNHFLKERGLIEAHVGLASINHMRDAYNLYYSDTYKYSGVIKKDNSNDVSLSSIPKGETPIAILYFNKDGYSVYCKRYKDYWDWVEKRNEVRFETTLSHGKKYDSKNMMHVFRLLLMAREIALDGKINVHRKDREYLLKIKSGAFEYDDLVAKAELIKNELPALYRDAELAEVPDVAAIYRLLINMRQLYYERQ